MFQRYRRRQILGDEDEVEVLTSSSLTFRQMRQHEPQGHYSCNLSHRDLIKIKFTGQPLSSSVQYCLGECRLIESYARGSTHLSNRFLVQCTSSPPSLPADSKRATEADDGKLIRQRRAKDVDHQSAVNTANDGSAQCTKHRAITSNSFSERVKLKMLDARVKTSEH